MGNKKEMKNLFITDQQYRVQEDQKYFIETMFLIRTSVSVILICIKGTIKSYYSKKFILQSFCPLFYM